MKTKIQNTDRPNPQRDDRTRPDPQRQPAPASRWRETIRYWWELGPRLLVSSPVVNAIASIASLITIADRIL